MYQIQIKGSFVWAAAVRFPPHSSAPRTPRKAQHSRPSNRLRSKKKKKKEQPPSIGSTIPGVAALIASSGGSLPGLLLFISGRSLPQPFGMPLDFPVCGILEATTDLLRGETADLLVRVRKLHDQRSQPSVSNRLNLGRGYL